MTLFYNKHFHRYHEIIPPPHQLILIHHYDMKKNIKNIQSAPPSLPTAPHRLPPLQIDDPQRRTYRWYNRLLSLLNLNTNHIINKARYCQLPLWKILFGSGGAGSWCPSLATWACVWELVLFFATLPTKSFLQLAVPERTWATLSNNRRRYECLSLGYLAALWGSRLPMSTCSCKAENKWMSNAVDYFMSI